MRKLQEPGVGTQDEFKGARREAILTRHWEHAGQFLMAEVEDWNEIAAATDPALIDFPIANFALSHCRHLLHYHQAAVGLVAKSGTLVIPILCRSGAFTIIEPTWPFQVAAAGCTLQD